MAILVNPWSGYPWVARRRAVIVYLTFLPMKAPTPEELLAHEKRSQLMAARVRQIEERLREQKLLKLEGTTAEAARAVLGAQTGQPAATTAPMEAPQAAAKSPAPERRPKGLDALNPEPSGSFEHFQPGAWKPAPAKRVK